MSEECPQWDHPGPTQYEERVIFMIAKPHILQAITTMDFTFVSKLGLNQGLLHER